jgi:MFS superfamily sulfate permease-like transporter
MGNSLRLAICDLSTSPYVDLAGAQMLAGLHEELASANVRLQIVEARASVRDRLEAEGVEEKVGRIGRFRSLADAVDDFLNSDPKP